MMSELIYLLSVISIQLGSEEVAMVTVQERLALAKAVTIEPCEA